MSRTNESKFEKPLQSYIKTNLKVQYIIQFIQKRLHLFDFPLGLVNYYIHFSIEFTLIITYTKLQS